MTNRTNLAQAGSPYLVAMVGRLFACGCSFPGLIALVLWMHTHTVRPR